MDSLHRLFGGIMRTSRFLLLLAVLLGLAACSDPQADPANEFPPSVSLEASHLEGEATFEATFLAHATDPDGNRLTYSWRVNDEPITEVTSPRLTLTFYEAGVYEVMVSVWDGLHEARASVTVTVRNEYRPEEAPDVVIIGFAGRCGVLTCFPPGSNSAYLSDAPQPNTLQAIERTFQELGYTSMSFSFRSHLHDSPTLGAGYRSAEALIKYVRDEWIRDFRDPTRVVLVAHSHGNQFMNLLAWDHPEVDIAYAIYLDAVCTLWDADHIDSGLFRNVYGSPANYPAPLNSTYYACNSFPVPSAGYLNISDVVPWNVTWGLELWSRGFIGSGLVRDASPNRRPDGMAGYSVGLLPYFETPEGHSESIREGSAGLTRILEAIRSLGLPTPSRAEM